MWALCFAAALASLIWARTETIATRGRSRSRFQSTLMQGVEVSLLVATVFADIALAVWAFATYAWYVPILGFVLISLLAGFISNHWTWLFWYKISLLLLIFSIAATGLLWWERWPFSN
jgi:hypothetical protein